jgi:hypothetical protein
VPRCWRRNCWSPILTFVAPGSCSVILLCASGGLPMWDLTGNRFNRVESSYNSGKPLLRSVIRRPCSVASLVVNDKQINGEFGAVPACGLPSSILRRGSGSTANSSSIRATIGVETREQACLRVLASNYSERMVYQTSFPHGEPVRLLSHPAVSVYRKGR